MNSDLNTAACCAPEAVRRMIFGLDAPVRLEDGRVACAVNLDNAATTPPFRQALTQIGRQMAYYGSIGRGKGQKSARSSGLYESGRATIKAFVGANSAKYTALYVNNTTDGMNKLASALVDGPTDIILTTRMEHHADDLPWRERAVTVYAEVDAQGRLIVDDFERILAAHGGAIRYVAVTAASNVTGYVNDVHAIARIAHSHGARIIVDGAQIVAHRAFSMVGQTPEEDIDFLVFSAHKMYAPFGGGAVVGLADVLNARLPKFFGGGMVEAVCDDSVRYAPVPDRFEAGSPNYAGVVGMLEAICMLRQIGFGYIEAHEQRLFRKALLGLSSIPGVTLYGDNANIADRIGILAFNVEGFTPEQTANLLAGYRGIAVRHGAFCAHPYVRRLTGEAETAPCTAPRGMVRVSFGIYNDERDVDCLLYAVWEMVRRGASALTQAAATVSAQPNDRG